MEGYKKKVIALLSEYHKREAQIKLLEIEYHAMEQLTPGVCAVRYEQVSAHTNKISSAVENEVAHLESLLEQLNALNEKLILLRLTNQKIDLILESMTAPYSNLLRLRYVENQSWYKVCRACPGYAEEYVRGVLNEKALTMFASLYYPEVNQVGLFDVHER